jgi:hypothetical protein
MKLNDKIKSRGVLGPECTGTVVGIMTGKMFRDINHQTDFTLWDKAHPNWDQDIVLYIAKDLPTPLMHEADRLREEERLGKKLRDAGETHAAIPAKEAYLHDWVEDVAMQILSKEEMKEKNCPYPPEEGYDEGPFPEGQGGIVK